MPAHPGHNGLCLNHASIHRRAFHREDDLLRELASPAGDFITRIDINHVLGKLFEALAANRVSPKRAATLAYIGHLLLQSQKGARFEACNWHSESKILSELIAIKYPDQSPGPAAPSANPAQPNPSAKPASPPKPSSKS